MTRTYRARGSLVINVAPAYMAAAFDTISCIDSQHSRNIVAPIVEYNVESVKLRRYATPTTFDPNLANWILLGQISLSESYFRALVRRIILIDRYSHIKVANHKVTYAAAHYLSKDMIPESLLEGDSLANPHNLKETFRSLLGIKGDFADITVPLVEYGRVCQLRHCIIHRFSYLGSSNAAVLGIDSHSNLIEKPVVFDFASLQNALQVIDVCVRSVNNFLFTTLIFRIANEGEWTWNYSDDRRKFSKYYNLFVDKSEVGYLSIKDAYNQLMTAMR